MFACYVRATSPRLLAAAATLLLVSMPTIALGQGTNVSGSNQGALKFTGGLDSPSIYYFRGFRQERDPAVTLWPYGDIGIAVRSHETGLRSVAVNFGVWNSLQTGSSGIEGPSKRLHYEEDFYTTLTFGFGRGLAGSATFTANT